MELNSIEPTLTVTISGSTDKFYRRELNCFLVRSNDEVIPEGIQTLDFGVGEKGKKFMARLKLNVAADNQERYRVKIELSGADPVYSNEFKVI